MPVDCPLRSRAHAYSGAVSDVSRYLPLSQRPRSDESGVTGDWTARHATVLLALADRLQRLSPAEWDAASGQAGWSVRDIVGELEWRLTTTAATRARAIALRLVAHPGAPRSAARHIAHLRGAASPESLVAALRSAATSRRRRPLRDLATVVVASLDVDPALPIDRLALGAVALARSLSAPLPIRAVIRTVTLTADDGGWSVGHGRQVRAPGAHIVRFLYGRAGLPANTMEGTDETARHRPHGSSDAQSQQAQGRHDG
jgi:hypothetical protein